MQTFKIAKVLKPQGIKGEIKVECFTSDLDFLINLKQFTIDDVIYNIESIRIQKKYAYIKIQEVKTRNDAELLRNKVLKAQMSSEDLKEDEFFISDLEDCCVVDEGDNVVGYVESIEKYGSADIVTLKIAGATKSFPLLKSVLKEVDTKKKKIVVYREKIDEVLV